MVRLRALAVQGFKSFGSRRTVIKLPPGLIVITGPNGGGKSTVLDAVKFALGELSAHNLRADRFSKLLHESAKGQEQHASVSLTLDNHERTIPVDSDEVVLTRRLSSTGESEYLVNGRSVSRNEMLTLLSAANIKPDGLNLVTQGSVVGIAEMNSRELRQMLEDAAGISGYKKRRDEALKELEAAQRNLDVAKAATSEVRSRVKQLELERNQYLRKTLVEREMGRLRSASLQLEAKALRQQLIQLETHAEEVMKNLAEKQGELQDAEHKVSQLRMEVEELQHSRVERGAVIRDLENQSYVKKSEKTRLEAELKSLQTTLERVVDQRKLLTERMQKLRERSAELQARLEEKTSEAEQAAQAHKSAENQLKALREEAEAVRKKLEELEEAYESKINEVRYLKLSDDGRSLLLENLEKQIHAKRKEADEVRRQLEEIHRRRETTAAAIGENRALEASISSSADELASKLKAEREKAEQVYRKINELNKVLEEARFLRNTLEDLVESVRKSGSRSRVDSPVKTVAEHFGDKLEPHLAAALGDWVNALVVDDIDNALSLAARSAELGIPLKIIPLTKTGPDIERVVQSITGSPPPKRVDSATQLTAEDRNAATSDGVYIGQNYSISVSAGRAEERLAAVVENGLRKLEQVCAAITSKHSKLEKELTSLRESIKQKEEEAEALKKKLNEKRLETGRLEASLNSLDKQLESGRSRLLAVEKSITGLQEDAEKLRNTLAEKSGELEALARLKAEVESLRAEVRRADEAVRRKSAEASVLYKNYLDVERQRDSIAIELKTIAERLENGEKELALLTNQSERAAAEAEAVKSKISVVGEELDRLEALRADAEALLRDVEQRLESKTKELRETEKLLQKLREEMSSLEKENNNIMVERVRLETALQSLNERLRAMTSLEDDGQALIPQELLPSLEEEAREIAVVNQLAVMQYDSIVPNYKLRSTRINELEMERSRILEFIESINREEVEAFNKALERVSESFNFYFNQLTGGEGYLRLENPQDPLNSGVEMIVKFVGKQPRSTSSVSGGEKSVSAVALILALQDLTPAQFYIFDEIDAHLDVVYVKNLVNLMKKMSSKKQIIIITLKDIIAEQADALFGVYMVNESSQVVKTRLAEVA
ncbi:MAG: chromosome segregation protein SMC [Candidatus Caldarchaeum sp.]|nr:chromosome segregation protein SMC [Candidatus Caldarchaeum sp.]